MPLKAVNYINTESPLGHNIAVVVIVVGLFIRHTHTFTRGTHKANTQNRCHDNTTSETNDNNDVGNGGGGGGDDNDRRKKQDKNCFLGMQNDSVANTVHC